MARTRGSSLKRRAAFLKPRAKFYIICEGRNTEPGYFNALSSRFKSSIVEVIIEGGAGVPRTLFEKANRIAKKMGAGRGRKRRGADSFEEDDEVWICFDKDNHPRFLETINNCAQVGIGCAYSNPCFELWLILHYEPFNGPCGPDDAQKRLEALCPDYCRKERKTLNFSNIVASVEIAEDRAELLIKHRAAEGDLYGCCSTTVHHLARSIRNKANQALGKGGQLAL